MNEAKRKFSWKLYFFAINVASISVSLSSLPSSLSNFSICNPFSTHMGGIFFSFFIYLMHVWHIYWEILLKYSSIHQYSQVFWYRFCKVFGDSRSIHMNIHSKLINGHSNNLYQCSFQFVYVETSLVFPSDKISFENILLQVWFFSCDLHQEWLLLSFFSDRLKSFLVIADVEYNIFMIIKLWTTWLNNSC